MQASTTNMPFDARWQLEARGYDPATESMIESVFALVNGYSGTRAALEEGDDVSYPALYVAGIFNMPAAPQASELQEPIPELVRAPDWSRIRIVTEGQELQIGHVELLEQRRVLDMQRGVLLREWRVRDTGGRVTRLRSLRFASLDNRHVFVQQLAITPENYRGALMLEASVDGNVRNENKTQHLALVDAQTADHGAALTMRTLQSGYVLSFAANAMLSGTDMAPVGDPFVEEARVGQRWTWQAEQGQTYMLDKRVVVYTSRDAADPLTAASEQLAALGSTDELLDAHAAAWAARWQASDAVITGSEERQQQARWAIYQLIGAANPDDEQASIGARSITGERYRGHVFWDNETFVWPFYPFTDPQTARALLMYRYHRLDGARHKAQALGYRGALYPWESTDTGEETTPPFINVPGRGVQPVLTGLEEHHLAADIAYAVVQYRQATGDEQFFLDYGAEMLLEIARFWASRVEEDDQGRYHIRKVIGPDEYHESVDDNAYTNIMAQWTLRRGLEAAELRESFPERWKALAARLGIEQRELDTWQKVADKLVTGFDPATQLFEQFDGYYTLREVDLSGHSTAEKTMDIKLGWEEIQRTQVIKQSDVVMLLFLLWEQFPPDVREKNFRFYEPRTAHDSSLSPSFHALVAARLGDLPMAERYLHQAATIDLDFTRKGWAGAAGGVHIAAIGGIWQALAFGFLGMQPTDNGVRFRPHIPAQWGMLQMLIQWRGSQLRVTAQAAGSVEIRVESGNEVTLAVGDGAWQTVAAGATLCG